MPNPPALADAQSLPLQIRVSLWMLCGAALGLPVDVLVRAIDQQLAVAKRSLAGKRVGMTTAERLTHAKTMERQVGPFRELFQWIVSPDALIRWLKRYQQRRANGDGKNYTKKSGRPWIGQDKVDAILRIYDSGLTGLSRIVGEMGKCGLDVAETSVRRVLHSTAGRRPTTTVVAARPGRSSGPGLSQHRRRRLHPDAHRSAREGRQRLRFRRHRARHPPRPPPRHHHPPQQCLDRPPGGCCARVAEP